MERLDTALARRDFLRASAAIGGGLLIAFHWPELAGAQGGKSQVDHDGPSGPAMFVPNAFVKVAPDGRVTVIINKAEMGQGVCTSLAMIVAEELDADWSTVGFEFAPVDPVYAHPGFGIQMTGGSTSVLGMSQPLRVAGATARAMLVEAAAKGWSVDASTCSTEPGAVVHKASGRRVGYGELVDAASEIAPPKDVPLKKPADYRIVGKPTKRLDTVDKVHGKAVFSLDVRLEGQLVALVAHPPVFGGKAKSVKSDAATKVPGVRKVVQVSSGVAVIADGFWPAKQGRDRLEIEWDPGPNAELSSEKLHAHYRELARTAGKPAREDGDAEDAIAKAARKLEADYELPFLAHAPMEPLNCVVDLKADRCEIWAGTQFQTVDHAAACRVAGLPPDKVKLHTTFMGGGFGRRANPVSDYIVEAVEVAKHAGAPLQLVWTREDDTRGGYYRPMWHSRLRAGVDAQNRIAGWAHTIVGQSFIAGTPFEPFIIKDGIDGTSVEGAEDLPYAIENVLVDLHTTKVGVPTLWFRSVGHSHTAFVVESFLDEVAHACGEDPYELRRKLLATKPRHLGVLERAAKEAGWGRPLAQGRARGIAVHFSFESYVADVAEVSMENGRPRVHRLTRAVDCGRVVNPDTIRNQFEGGAAFALTALFHGAITLKDGRVEQANFYDYKMLRMPEMPEVDVHIVDSNEPSTGVGEPTFPTVAPAVCNALFTLTGKRIRRLPLRAEDLRA